MRFSRIWLLAFTLFSASAKAADLIVSGGTITLTNNGQITTNGNVQISNGRLESLATTSLVVGGSWTVTGGQFSAVGSTVTFNATSGLSTIRSSGQAFDQIRFAGAGGTWQLQDPLVVGSTLTLSAGTLDTNAGGNYGISVAQGWERTGGNFVANTSTVTFTSTATITGSTTFYNLLSNTPGITLTFQTGSTTTVVGQLTLTGGVGDLLKVRSSQTGFYSYLINQTTNTVTLVDAQDNNASGGLLIDAGPTSVDSGHLVNWNFLGRAPTNPTISTVWISSISVSWGTVPYTNGYVLQASTASDFSGTVQSSTTASGALSALTVLSLSPNTTYYLRVGAIYPAGNRYANTTPISTSTLTNLITGAQVQTVSISSITANWNSLLGSGGSEGYRLQASTASNFTGTIYSSTTLDVSVTTLTIGGLASGTTYYLRVGGLNWNTVANYVAFGSTCTASGSGAAPTSPVLFGINHTTATISWGTVPGTSGYVVDASTAADFSGTIASSVTANGSATSLVVSGLLSNTTYFFRAGAVYSGATSYALTTPISSSTLTNPISSGSPVAFATSTIRWNWTALPASPQDQSGEGYLLQASTASNFTGTIFSSQTTSVAVNALTISGLTHHTTYYFRVGGLNWNNVPNFTALGSAQTNSLASPSGLFGTATAPDMIVWTWGALTGATSYNLYVASNPITPVYSGLGNSYNEPSLSTNTAYGRSVSAMIAGRETSLSAGATVYTQAAVPTGLVASGVARSSATISWNSEGNPGYTPYEVSRSDDSSFALSVTTITFAQNLTALTTAYTDLSPSTTYYVRIRARNGDGSQTTAFSTVLSFVTAPINPPTGLAGTTLGTSSITWTWDAISGATYNLYVASSPSTPIALGLASANYTETGLPVNTEIGRVVTAVWNVTESALSPAATAFTESTVPSPVGISNVAYTSFTVTWTPNGNPAGTTYVVVVSTGANAGTNGFSLNVSTITTGNSVVVNGLIDNTLYYADVQSFSLGGVGSSFVFVGSTQTVEIIPPPDTPKRPQGMVGTLSSNQLQFTLDWKAVTKDISNRIIPINRYDIERSNALLGPYTPWTSTVGLSVTDSFSGTVMYYRIKAVYSPTIQSGYSDVMDSLGNRYVVALSNPATRLIIPHAGTLQMRSENNTAGKDIEVSESSLSGQIGGAVMQAHRFEVLDADTSSPLSGFAFSTPVTVQLGLLSPSTGNENMALYWLNGGQYQRMTNPTIASGLTELSAQTYQLGDFQIRTAAPTQDFRLADGSPYPRVFSPDRPQNRRVFFVVENETGFEPEGAIYNIRNQKIRTLHASDSTLSGALMWDGRDDGGRVVPAGIYMYQLTAGTINLTGTVVVAR